MSNSLENPPSQAQHTVTDEVGPDMPVSTKQLRRLEWTPELSRVLWSDLSGSEFGETTAFSRFSSPYLIELVRHHLLSEGLFLDYGGGDNLFLVRELLRNGYQVACFEPNSDIEERNRDLRSNPRFLGAVSEIEAGRYDVIFISEVLEHLRDPEASNVLQRLHAGLNPHGTLIVTTPENEDLFAASRYCPTCRTLFHPWGHVRAFNARTLELILRESGFLCEELHSVDFSANREPIEKAKRDSKTLFELAEHLDQLRSAFVNRLNEEEIESLERAIGELRAVAIPDSSDPKRRHIGFGGTLVAVAKKADCVGSICAG